MRHELKTWPEPFQAAWDGRKKAEFRESDRNFAPGDELLLREFDTSLRDHAAPGYTGRELLVQVTDIRQGGVTGIPVGYVLLSFAPQRWANRALVPSATVGGAP